MKHILLSVFLTIVAATAAFAQSESKAPPSKRSVEGQLIELERQLSAALVREMPPSLTGCGVTISSLRSLTAKYLTRPSDSPDKNLPLRPPNLKRRILTTRSRFTSMGTLLW